MPAGTIADIKSKLSAVEVVGETVALKRAGALYRGLCPFHAEKTPSFIVTPERETWHCFGCGEGGDVFSFVMRRDGVDFREALVRLAERAGVELSDRAAGEDRRRRRLREVLEAAFGFYREVLLHARLAQRARDYLVERGFSDETLERFGIGFAPDDWQALSSRLSARGYTDDELVAVGLAGRTDKRKVYDRFRGRVVFPIRDRSGAAIGLGGRLLPGADGPKYLNSPATPLFDKSTVLYGIHLAKAGMRREKLAVIVEGFTDVLAAHQAGFDNVVASLGTALTAGQVALATRFADAVALAYDVDLAGQAATERGLLDELGPDQSVTKVRVIRIPAGKDPDELIRNDPAAWASAVAAAKPVVEYFIERRAEGVDLGTVSGRRDLSAGVLGLLRRVGDPLERNLYLQQLARIVNVDEAILRQALERQSGDGRGSAQAAGGRPRMAAAPQPTGRPAPRGAGAVAAIPVAGGLPPLEREAVQLALRHPAAAAEADRAHPLPLRDSAAAALLDAWRAWRAAGGATHDLAAFVETLDTATGELARTVLDGEHAAGAAALSPDDAREAFRVCILRLRSERIGEDMRGLRLLLDDAARNHDREQLELIEQRIDRLGREKAEINRAMSEPAGAVARRA